MTSSEQQPDADLESGDPIGVVRKAFLAFLRQDFESLRELVDPDLEWTYLDPTSPTPQPATCFGRQQLEAGAEKWAAMGLTTQIEEIFRRGGKVLVVLHTPGLDNFRARTADDRNFFVATVRDSKVQSLRACIDRAEARFLVQLDSREP